MQTYEQANKVLTGRCKNRRKLCNHTYLERRNDEEIAVKLHGTDVVTYHRLNFCTLNSGGWKTPTTKNRINTYAPVQIYQKSGLWYIDGKLFEDHCHISDGGAVLTVLEDPAETITKKRKIDRMVAKYIKDFCAHIKAGKLEDPSNGDCWGCLMADNDGNNDIMTGVNHYFDHFKEEYFVPSLLWKAINEAGYTNPSFIWAMIKMDGEKGKDSYHALQTLQRYFRKRKDKLIAAL